ncbi:MAG: hypothetical protein Q4G25_09620 [Paracoccus sp. (in: a-proteobacteria)]|nr:hypothetical protein [Paracoccus sp. (in: a-proteobacteria)]
MAEAEYLLERAAQALISGQAEDAFQLVEAAEQLMDQNLVDHGALADRLARLKDLAEAALQGVADARATLQAARRDATTVQTYDELGKPCPVQNRNVEIGRF